MNLFKLFLVAVSGLGVGFTTTQVIGHGETDDPINQDQEEYEYGYGYGCHRYEPFLDNFLSHYSDEDQVLISAFVDTWLIEQNVTLEDVEDDFDLRHDLMFAVHEFVEEQQLEEDDDDYHGHGHMGW